MSEKSNADVLPNTESEREEDRLGLRERNSVQVKIMEKMIESGIIKTEREWVIVYGQRVSDIMDNPQNLEIRELIKEGNQNSIKYDQAVDLIVPLLSDSLMNKAA